MLQRKHLGQSSRHRTRPGAAVRAEHGDHAAQAQGAGRSVQVKQRPHGLQQFVHGQGLRKIFIRAGGQSLPIESEVIGAADGHDLHLGGAALPQLAQQRQGRTLAGNIEHHGAMTRQVGRRQVLEKICLCPHIQTKPHGDAACLKAGPNLGKSRFARQQQRRFEPFFLKHLRGVFAPPFKRVAHCFPYCPDVPTSTDWSESPRTLPPW